MKKTNKHLRLILLILLIILCFTMCSYDPLRSMIHELTRPANTPECPVCPVCKPCECPKCEVCEKKKPKPKPAPTKKPKKEIKETTPPKKPEPKKYNPYIEIGGTRFFNSSEPSWSAALDLFAPIWQSNSLGSLAPDQILFINPRYTDRPGAAFEINLHAGYRQLFDQQSKMIGVYAGFDRKKTIFKSFFNQVMAGVEYWQKLPKGNIFFGANIYEPIGSDNFIGATTETDIESYKNRPFKNIGVTKDLKFEKAMSGFDAEVGYEFIQGLILYAGGYYFGASNMDPVYGPKARLTYDLYVKGGKKVLGMFEKIGFVLGAQSDNPRGFTCYLGINARLNWLRGKQPYFDGITYHMMDLIRRDIDIVSDDYAKKEHKKRQEELKKQNPPAPPPPPKPEPAMIEEPTPEDNTEESPSALEDKSASDKNNAEE